MGKHNVSVQSLPFRASSSPTSRHIITETSKGPSEEIRHQMRDLPCKQIEYLGFVVDSVAMKLYLPEKKVADICRQCLDLPQTGKTSVPLLAKVTINITMDAIPDGLGSTLQQCEDTGFVDRRGEKATHQCTLNQSRAVSCPIICQGPAEDTYPSKSGQHHNYHNYCRKPTCLLKSNSGCSVETVPSHQQLDVGNPNISSLNESSGTSCDRSVHGSR